MSCNHIPRETIFLSRRLELKQYVRESDTLSRDGVTDKEICELYTSIMRRILQEQIIRRDIKLMRMDHLRSVKPYANMLGFHEVDRTSSAAPSLLIIPLSMGAVQDMIVVVNAMNAIRCEEIWVGKHGCVYMPFINPHLNVRPFSLFVKHSDNRVFYLGRYSVGKMPQRLVSVEGWQQLPTNKQHSMAQIVAGEEGVGPTAIPRILEEYNCGRRRLCIVPLFCGYFDMDVQSKSYQGSLTNSGNVKLDRPATRFPGVF